MTRQEDGQADVIRVCEPVLDGNELAYVTEAVKSGWVSSAGHFIDRFERAFAEYCGVRHAVAVSNGTAALQVAVRALRLAPGSEVVLPTFTIVSCAIAVVDSGLTPVFVDVDEDTFTLSAATVEPALGERTAAVMAVHMYGHPVDVDPLRALLAPRATPLVEDAAEAHGGRYHGRPCGSLGDIAAFSFYANKLITTGEGGMVTTDDDELAARCRSLRNLCFLPGRRFVHEELGWNFRLTNLQAALGLAQLERAAFRLEQKRQVAAWYIERLAEVPELTLPIERPGCVNTYWMFAILLRCDDRLDAAELATRLSARGIETRPFFQPLHRQAPFARFAAAQCQATFPVAERIARWGLYLPSGPGLDEPAVDRVCCAVKDALSE